MKNNQNHVIIILLCVIISGIPLTVQAQRMAPNYFRPWDQRGLAVFEDPFYPTVLPPSGVSLYWGGAFTQQFQALDHENDAVGDGTGLIDIGPGFNLATANLNLDAQLVEGVRVNLVTYLSSRHHSEAWVKGGYIQVDEAGFLGSEALDRAFEHLRARVGHFEINYGDAHFRRTDNGNAIWNPFVGNYLMDAFTTEVGGELYFYTGDFFAMGAVTGGQLHPSVTDPDDRSPAFYGKLGFDRDLADDLRVRLTGSVYSTRSGNITLYAGDRAGSRYYFVLEPVGATESGNFRSGRINPNFSEELTAFMINPFLKYKGLELFGVFEVANGGPEEGNDGRTYNQWAIEALYRFLPAEQIYVGARYNAVDGVLRGNGDDINVQRIQIGAGWFATPNILLKAEYVKQTHGGYPENNILHDGQFDGFVLEGVVAF